MTVHLVKIFAEIFYEMCVREAVVASLSTPTLKNRGLPALNDLVD